MKINLDALYGLIIGVVMTVIVFLVLKWGNKMGIYISGLEMPQEGRITLQIDSSGGVYVVNKFKIISEKYEESMIATEI